MNEIIEIIPVGSFQCNCIILGDPVSKEAIVIDPGDELEKILSKIRFHSLTVKSIVHTHTHIDHIGSTTPLQKETNARVLLHKEDQLLYEKMDVQASFLGLPTSKVHKPVPPDGYLTDGQELSVGSLKGTVLHSPGHTPGSCGFYFPKLKNSGTLFPGDTLFAGSIGRTDLWGGDYDLEISSIKKKFLILPEETIIVPGHGPRTTIAQEKKLNPFLN